MICSVTSTARARVTTFDSALNAVNNALSQIWFTSRGTPPEY